MTSTEKLPSNADTSDPKKVFDYLYEEFKNLKEQILNKIESKDDRERLYHALTVAIKTHEGQERRISGLPYIVHPLEVLAKALQVTDNVDILIACLLHDGPEDRPQKFAAAINNENTSNINDEDDLPPAKKITNLILAYRSLASKFSPKIANIVLGVTKNVAEDDWHKRAKPYIKTVEFEAPPESSILCAVDKICNLKNRLKEYEEAKDINDVSIEFNSKIREQLWWFKANAKMLRRKSNQEDFKYKQELSILVDELDGLVDQFDRLVNPHISIHRIMKKTLACAIDSKQKEKLKNTSAPKRLGTLVCKLSPSGYKTSQYKRVLSFSTNNHS